jgi:hypothetical protein
MTRKLLLPLLCALAALALAAGCGEDGDGGDSPATLAEAKKALIDDCHRGNEGDERDLALCRCIADQLERKHGYGSPEKFEDARQRVADDDVPQEVQSAAASPECRKTQQP